MKNARCGPGRPPTRPESRGPSRRLNGALPLAFLFTIVMALVGCGPPPPPPPPPAFSPVTGAIPATTPYVAVVRASAYTEAEMGSHLRELAAEGGLPEILRQRLRSVLHIDIFEPRDVAQTGLDLSGDIAIFGVALRPALLIRIADRQAFRGFLESVRTRNPDLVFGSLVVDERTVDSLQLGESAISMVEVADDYLVAVYHRSDTDPSEVFGPLMALDHTTDLGHSPLFLDALEHLDGDGVGSVIWVNLGALDGALLERADPERDPRYIHVPEQKRAQIASRERGFHDTCAAAGRDLVTRMPWLGLRFEDGLNESTQRLIVPVDDTLRTGVEAILSPTGGRYAAVSQDAIVSFALALDFGALAEHAGGRRELVACPSIAAFEGALAVAGDALSKTDASEAFRGPIYGALYNFDMAMEWFTSRSGAIFIESDHVDALAAGLKLWLGGIGMVSSGEDELGRETFSGFMGMVSVTVVPGEGHAAIVLGSIPDERMAALEDEPASQPTVDKAARLRLELDGERVRTAFSDAMAILAPAGLDMAATETFARTFEGLVSASWSAWSEPGALVFEAKWRRLQPSR